MRFIDELTEIDEEHAECRCDCKKADRLELFKDENGIIPNVFLIEMMAQAIGVWAGYY
ncbi:ApeP family dehydratase, partial [Turicimonas muris]